VLGDRPRMEQKSERWLPRRRSRSTVRPVSRADDDGRERPARQRRFAHRRHRRQRCRRPPQPDKCRAEIPV